MSISGITRGNLHACGRETFNTNNCRACEPACRGGGDMAPILTGEDVVRRIATECTYVDERGGVGIRLRPAAAIVRQYGEQSPPAPAQADAALAETAAPALSGRWWFEFFLHLTFATPNPLRTHPDIAPSRSSESRFRSDRKQS